jgi:hypothetical protein
MQNQVNAAEVRRIVNNSWNKPALSREQAEEIAKRNRHFDLLVDTIKTDPHFFD